MIPGHLKTLGGINDGRILISGFYLRRKKEKSKKQHFFTFCPNWGLNPKPPKNGKTGCPTLPPPSFPALGLVPVSQAQVVTEENTYMNYTEFLSPKFFSYTECLWQGDRFKRSRQLLPVAQQVRNPSVAMLIYASGPIHVAEKGRKVKKKHFSLSSQRGSKMRKFTFRVFSLNFTLFPLNAFSASNLAKMSEMS